MAAPTIYRSTDTGAPILNGSAGAFIRLLNACLVSGFGATRATATITSSGVNVSNNDTVTVNGTVYTFKTALTPAANEVLIGASAAASLSNLCAAMSGWGTSGTTYGAGTTQQTLIQVTGLTATVITLQAYTGGTGGNALTLAKSAVTLTVSGATFSGGAGSDTTVSLGWGSPFTGTNKAVYRAASGARHYLDVDDSSPDATANGRNVRVRGYETMTAVGTGTNLFPTTTQVTTCVGVVKSTTSDQVARPWIIIGDDKTFYLFIESAGTDPPNLGSHTWTTGFFFGEILSALSGDLYRSILSFQSTSTSAVTAALSAFSAIDTVSTAAAINQNMPRSYTGAGGSLWVGLLGNPALASTNTNVISGLITTFPNPVDGGLYQNAVDVGERGSGTTASSMAGSAGFRGRLRGFYQTPYVGTGINDQDTFTGVGDFAGKTFIALKMTAGLIAIETTAWAASS